MYSNKDSSLDAASEFTQASIAATSSSRILPIIPSLDPFATAEIPIRTRRPRSPESSREEQALEWHEVIELQAFSERKVWIEEKTRLLEKMPPIQVFIGLDAVRASAEEVPGLPTREELQRWLAEHDKIEKETEIFDSGELRKLKKLTKAATQRNLSPADTDLIEITLTTIYALDKLLHLLRDRSDNLELLGDRLTWEEKRISSWVELRRLQADLNNFLITRARWSPSVYDRIHDEDEIPGSLRDVSPSPLPSLRRKSSVSSFMSTASESTISSLALSRGERFKLAETLSRDAAQFSSRVSSLRHSKITAAGKALDKLIDDSRKPVPDELLDEQDKLEDKGINEMEDVGKFVMAVVMQWKKADEIYVETAKDKSTAQTLLEEIEIAKLNHPTSRQDTTFLSRSTALVKRLKIRENPSSPTSFFPQPTHPLFPDQRKANGEITNILSAELAATQEQAHEAEQAAKEYHATVEKVKEVETLSDSAKDLTVQLESLLHRLETGVESDAGDGSPPTLSSESCLHSNSHSVYLARAPELLDTVSKVEQAANEAITSGRVALATLPRSAIDPQFMENIVAAFDRLASYRNSTINIRSSVTIRTETLRRCRSIWSSMAESFDKLDNLRHDVVETIQKQMYKPNSSQDAALLTPESPSSLLTSPELTTAQASEMIDTLASVMDTSITGPLSTMVGSVGPALNTYLSECSSGLQQSLDELKRLTHSWSLVRTQALEMEAISDDVHGLQMRLEHIKLELEGSTQGVLSGSLSGEDLQQKDAELGTMVEQLIAEVQAFQENLSLRLSFIGSSERPRVSGLTSIPTRRRFSISTGFSLEVVRQAALVGLPFDAGALDRAVRADANSYSILLAGEVESLSRSSNIFHWAQQARAIDVTVADVSDMLHEATTSLNSIQMHLNESDKLFSLDELHSISAQIDSLYRERGQPLGTSCTTLRSLLQRLEVDSTIRDSPYDATMLGTRRRALEEVEEKLSSWRENVEVLGEQLADMQHAERMRLDAEAAAHAAQEEAERKRLEEEELKEELRLEAEEKLRREEEERLRREEEDTLKRKIAEEEARAIAETQLLQAEAKARAEAERKAEVDREVEKRNKLAAEQAKAEEERQLAEETNRDPFVVASRSHMAADRIESEMELPKGKRRASPVHRADVFGIARENSMESTKSAEDATLQSLIVSLRKRLRSLNINETARSPRDTASSLPSEEVASMIKQELEALQNETDALPASIPTAPYVGAELRSLRSELGASSDMLDKIRTLSNFGATVQKCDDLLSDLLEHIDSYPAPPLVTSSTLHTTDTSRHPENQMSDRLAFTEELVQKLISQAQPIANDIRVSSERSRVVQTWEELHAMGDDRINGQKSRPPSVMSSGRSSRASAAPSPHPRPSGSKKAMPKKPAPYAKLSTAPSGNKHLAPPPIGRRSTSRSSSAVPSRPSSRASTNRSVSGPMITTPVATSRLYTSTFASRQRSSSINSPIATIVESPHRATPPLSSAPRVPGNRPRARTGQSTRERVGSPLVTDLPRSQSRASRSSLSTNRPTWSRAPRKSFTDVPKSPPPRKPSSTEKKPYVPNPKNKLDMAVGDVVNNLHANINIEVVADTWKDQSGKYWIGSDDDPKLCFCRILRSQTVMVRVGGGWAELSKFIKEHFADAFRVLPLSESPPHQRAQGEKWISSITLAQAMSDKAQSPPLPPRTPEPQLPFIPTFALSTPSGTSPRTIKTSSPGSPLHAMQFIRRADRDSIPARPETPSKITRPATSLSHNRRQPVWRP
ncbi:hypothetical protein BDY19DRAFT_925147 [Irpex rosettiformis]|uniref:Uncharacterized protein n=1 Tax=Irpex rosettiformis TaxID=378272 RepID=A0ACB8UED6_9APHY|nr:hypothetical protein BDY19DRAFT_925147 [Irpex rosettiformis]